MLNLEKLLSQNELRIFKAVYEAGPVSRVKVARGLHLTRAAVSINIKRLKELNLIMEVGKGSSGDRRGRREVLLGVNADAGSMIAIHMARGQVTYGILNFGGKVLDKRIITLQPDSTPDLVMPVLVQGLYDLLEELAVNEDTILGIGVAVPGIINYAEGHVIECTIPGWEKYPLKSFLESHFDTRILLENDVKTLTLGEFQFGTNRHISNLVCLLMADGIGVGITIEGRLMRGVTASAGEIGFHEFVLDLPTKKSILINNKPQCLGDIVSFTNIKASIKRGLQEGWQTSLGTSATIKDFIEAVEQNDPLALHIFQTLNRILGAVCRNLIYTFNPQTLVLSGPMFYDTPILADGVRNQLKKALLRSPVEAVELKTSMLGDNGVIIGCGALLLEHLFKASELKSMHSPSEVRHELVD